MRKTCEICGRNPAVYVCSECGRNVCPECFEPDDWICSICYEKRHNASGRGPSIPHLLPTNLLMIGFLLIFLGVILMFIAGLTGGISASSGLIIFIGPIPIILGAGKYSLLAVILAVILTIFGFILYIFLRRLGFRGELYKEKPI